MVVTVAELYRRDGRYDEPRTNRAALLALFLAVASTVLLVVNRLLYRSHVVGLEPAFTVLRWAVYGAHCDAAGRRRRDRHRDAPRERHDDRGRRAGARRGGVRAAGLEAASGVAAAAHPRHHDRHGPPAPVRQRRPAARGRGESRRVRRSGDRRATAPGVSGYCSRCHCRCRRIRHSTRRWPRRAGWDGRSWRRIRRRDASRPPTRRSGSASRTTSWSGWPPAQNGSRVDVRSLSRVGLSDVGTNAARIRKYLAALGNASSAS